MLQNYKIVRTTQNKYTTFLLLSNKTLFEIVKDVYTRGQERCVHRQDRTSIEVVRPVCRLTGELSL